MRWAMQEMNMNSKEFKLINYILKGICQTTRQAGSDLFLKCFWEGPPFASGPSRALR